MEERLLGYLLEILDPDERAEIEALLRENPEWQAKLEELRQTLEPLHADDEAIEPPENLVDRTCSLIESPEAQLPPATYERVACSWWRLQDALVIGSLAIAAILLIVPAIYTMRFESQLTSCQGNLRQLGVALINYSQFNRDWFPHTDNSATLTPASIYGPALLDQGFLDDPFVLLCPDSKQARQDSFRIPTLRELQTAGPKELPTLRRRAAGSYGYTLGYSDAAGYHPPRNRHRNSHPIVSDAPSLHLAEFQTANHDSTGQNVLFETGHVQFLFHPQLRGQGEQIFLNAHGYIRPGTHPDDVVICNSWLSPRWTAE